MQTEEQLIADSTEETSSDSNTSTSTKSEEKIYAMDTNPITVKINYTPSMPKPTYGEHTFRKPSFLEEEARERNIPLLTIDLGEVEGKDGSSTTVDDEPANAELYDKILLKVKGYALEAGGKGDEELNADMTVETKDGVKTVRECIPDNHKRTAINGMFLSSFDLDFKEDQGYVFALSGGRTWTIKQEIGGKHPQGDGTLSAPDYVVRYELAEPTEEHRKNFRTKAMPAVNMRDKRTGESVERRSINLAVMRDLFDALVVNVEGATVGGQPINANDKSHVAEIPANFKKGVILKLFNGMEADLGN